MNAQGASNPDEDLRSGLPLRESRRYDRVVIGSHLILHGYGHWLPNDPRGSGSNAVREEKLADLGAVHHGRKRVQPPRVELKQFYLRAEARLDFPTIWFDDAKRQAIGDAFAQIAASRKYTVWGCAILRNHARLCVRRHRDDPVMMWRAFAEESACSLRQFPGVPPTHPVWSSCPYKVSLKSPPDVHRVVTYVERNPSKESCPPQSWSFVRAYDGFRSRRQGAQGQV